MNKIQELGLDRPWFLLVSLGLFLSPSFSLFFLMPDSSPRTKYGNDRNKTQALPHNEQEKVSVKVQKNKIWAWCDDCKKVKGARDLVRIHPDTEIRL